MQEFDKVPNKVRDKGSWELVSGSWSFAEGAAGLVKLDCLGNYLRKARVVLPISQFEGRLGGGGCGRVLTAFGISRSQGRNEHRIVSIGKLYGALGQFDRSFAVPQR